MDHCLNSAMVEVSAPPGRTARRSPHARLARSLVAALVLSAGSGSMLGAAERRVVPEAKAPAAAQPSAQTGAQVYALRCSPCHGVDLNNTGGQAFDLRKLRPDEHDRFVSSVTTGKDTMPSWYGILSNAEIDAIWAYIRATVDR